MVLAVRIVMNHRDRGSRRSLSSFCVAYDPGLNSIVDVNKADVQETGLYEIEADAQVNQEQSSWRMKR